LPDEATEKPYTVLDLTGKGTLDRFFQTVFLYLDTDTLTPCTYYLVNVHPVVVHTPLHSRPQQGLYLQRESEWV